MKLIPVDYDPFADETQQKQAPAPKLVPVDYDPFAEERGQARAQDKGWYQEMMTGHIPDDIEVSQWGQENPNLYAAAMTAKDMGKAALHTLPEAVAFSLPAVMTGGASIPMGLTASALESATAAAPTVTRAMLTGLNTGAISGVNSVSEGNKAGQVLDDVGKGAATGAAMELAGDRAARVLGWTVGKAVDGVRAVVDHTAPLVSRPAATKKATQILLNSSDKLDLPRVDAAIEQAGKVEDALNSAAGPHAAPVRFNSAETFTEAPGLTSLNQKLNRLDSKAVEKAVDHRGDLNQAVTGLVERGTGAKGAGTIDDTLTAAKGGLDDFNSGLQAQEDVLQREFVDQVGQVPSLEASGSAGRQALNTQRSTMKRTVVNPAYDDVANVQVHADNLAAKLDEIATPSSAAENPANIPSELIERAKGAIDGGADLATLRDLEKEARQLKVNARTAQGNANQTLARRYQQIEEAIRSTIDNGTPIGSDALAPQAEKLRQANALFKDYASTYQEGPVGQVLKKRGYEHAVPDSDVVRRFFPKGAKNAESAAMAFRKAANGDPTAWQALEDGVLRDMMDIVAPTGIVEPKKFAAWYRNYHGALQQYPELRKRVGNVQRAQKALDDFWSKSSELRKQTETNVLKDFLGSDVDRSMGRILDSKNPVNEVNNLLKLVGGNAHAKNGIKREIMSYMKGKISTTRTINGQKVLSGPGMQKTYAKLKPAMQRVYSPAELRDVEIAIKAEEMMNSAWNPQLSGSPTAELLSGGEVDMAAAGLRTAAGATANSAFVVVDGATKLLRALMRKTGTDKTRQVLLKAMDNPRYLRELVAAAQTPKPDSTLTKVIRKYELDTPAAAIAKTITAGAKSWAYEP